MPGGSEIPENSTVSFTVKELLTEQTDILRDISHKVDGKADKADLVPIVSQLNDHHVRLQSIEDERKAENATREAHRSTRRTAAWVVAAIMVPFGTTLIFVFH